jgi:hypothetical protein
MASGVCANIKYDFFLNPRSILPADDVRILSALREAAFIDVTVVGCRSAFIFYIRDLRQAKWGLGVSLHGSNLGQPMSALCQKAEVNVIPQN